MSAAQEWNERRGMSEQMSAVRVKGDNGAKGSWDIRLESGRLSTRGGGTGRGFKSGGVSASKNGTASKQAQYSERKSAV